VDTKLLVNRRDMLRYAGLAAGGLAFGLGGAGFASAQTPAKTEKLKITIANAGGNSSLCMQELMKRQGYLDAFGVEAKVINVADSARIITGIVGGDIDVCMLAGFGQALPAIEKGAALRVLAGANTLAPDSLFSAKPDVKTIKDLEGKTIGTGAIGSALHQIAVALLEKNKIDVKKVTFVSIGATGDILKAVVSGVVDAGVVNVDAYDQAAEFKIHPIADFFTDLAEYPFQGSFTSEDAIKNKRDALVRTLAAHAKLYRFISGADSKKAYVDAYVAATGGKPSAGEAQWSFIQKYKPYAVDLVIPDGNIEYIQDLNLKTGVQKKALPVEKISDMSLARDALKLLV
jgi:ABC-type nitrate/sulfonate/bicarbonate transport system substrate-binding protein